MKTKSFFQSVICITFIMGVMLANTSIFSQEASAYTDFIRVNIETNNEDFKVSFIKPEVLNTEIVRTSIRTDRLTLKLEGIIDTDHKIDHILINDIEVAVRGPENLFSMYLPVKAGNNEIQIRSTDMLTGAKLKHYRYLEVSPITNYPPILVFTSPVGISESTRGFKYVKKGSKREVKGFIQDENGLKEFKINNKIVDVDFEEGTFSHVMNLTRKENVIHVEIIDQDNFVFYDTLYWKTVVEESMDTSKNTLYNPGTYHALLISVNDYKDTQILDLNNPFKDVKDIKNVLIKQYTFDEKNVIMLHNPTRENFIDVFERLKNRIEVDDNLLIYYAGHGHWEEKEELGYWLPTDAKLNSKSKWIRNSTVTGLINSLPTQHTLLMADACFSGSIFSARSVKTNLDKVAATKYKLKSRKAMTSGTLTKVPDKSVFVNYFLNRLNNNSKQYLAANELFFTIEPGVINNSSVGQKPQYGVILNSNDEGGDFIFIRK